MGSVAHTALDGEVVEIESSHNLQLPVSTYVVAAQHEFESGPVKFGREVATDFNIHSFDESYAFQSGMLHRATRTITDLQGIDTLFSLALWEGTSYSVNTQVAARDGSGTVIQLFDLFAITESDTGLSLTPRAEEASFEDTPRTGLRMYKLIPGVGTLTIKKKTEGIERTLPSWRGQRVRGGELYRDDAVADDARRLFTLVGSSAVTILWPQRISREEDILDFLSEVVCNWGAA